MIHYELPGCTDDANEVNLLRRNQGIHDRWGSPRTRGSRRCKTALLGKVVRVAYEVIFRDGTVRGLRPLQNHLERSGAS